MISKLFKKLTIFSILFLASCSKNDTLDEISKDVHDQLSTSIEITLTKKGNITATINSEILKKNNQSLQLELYDNVNVNLFDENFEHKSLIKSQSAIVNEKENRMKAYGNVIVTSNDGKILMTDSLSWDNNSDKIYTNSNLEFITSDTDTLYGTGFESNIDLTDWNIIRFYIAIVICLSFNAINKKNVIDTILTSQEIRIQRTSASTI